MKNNLIWISCLLILISCNFPGSSINERAKKTSGFSSLPQDKPIQDKPQGLVILLPKNGDEFESGKISVQGKCSSPGQVEVSGPDLLTSTIIDCKNNLFLGIIELAIKAEQSNYQIRFIQKDQQVTIEIKQKQKPELLEVDFPKNEQVIKNNMILASGKCSEDVLVSGDDLENHTLECDQVNQSFAGVINLSLVENKTEYEVNFSLGSLLITRTIVYEKTVDPIEVKITAPADQFEYKEAVITVMGNCQSPDQVEISGDITQATMTNCENNMFSQSITIAEMAGKLEYEIQAKQGNQTDSIKVKKKPEPPVEDLLSVLTPSNNQEINSDEVLVNGKCSDNLQVSGVHVVAKTISCDKINQVFSNKIKINLQANQTDYNLKFTLKNLERNINLKYVDLNQFILNTPVDNSEFTTNSIQFAGSCHQMLKVTSVDITGGSMDIPCNNKSFQQDVIINIDPNKSNYNFIISHGNQLKNIGLIHKKMAPNAKPPYVSYPMDNDIITSNKLTVSGLCNIDVQIANHIDVVGAPVLAKCNGGMFSQEVELKIASNKSNYRLDFLHGNDSFDSKTIKYQEFISFDLTQPQNMDYFEAALVQFKGVCEEDVSINGDIIDGPKTIACSNRQFDQMIEIKLENGKKQYNLNLQHKLEQRDITLNYRTDEDFTLINPQAGDTILMREFDILGTCFKNISLAGTGVQAQSLNCSNGQFSGSVSLNNTATNFDLIVTHGQAQKTINLNFIDSEKFNLAKPIQNEKINTKNVEVAGTCVTDIKLEAPEITGGMMILICQNGQFSNTIALTIGQLQENILLKFTHGAVVVSRDIQYINDELFGVMQPMGNTTVSTDTITTSGTCRKNFQISGDVHNSPLEITCSNNSFNQNIQLNLMNGKTDYLLNYTHGNKSVSVNIKYMMAPKTAWEEFWEVYTYEPQGAASCASCHSNPANAFFPQFGNTEEEIKSFISDSNKSGDLKGLPIVLGQEAEKSALLLRIKGAPYSMNGVDADMPLGAGQGVFTSEQIQKIVNWINSIPKAKSGELAINSPSANTTIASTIFTLTGTCTPNYPVKISEENSKVIENNFNCSEDAEFSQTVVIKNGVSNGAFKLHIEQINLNKLIILPLELAVSNQPINGTLADQETINKPGLSNGLRFMTRTSIANRLKFIFPGAQAIIHKNITTQLSAFGESYDPMAAGFEINGQYEFPEYAQPASNYSTYMYPSNAQSNPLMPGNLLKVCIEIKEMQANLFSNVANNAGFNINDGVSAQNVNKLIQNIYPWIKQIDPGLTNTLINYRNASSNNKDAWEKIMQTIICTPFAFLL